MAGRGRAALPALTVRLRVGPRRRWAQQAGGGRHWHLKRDQSGSLPSPRCISPASLAYHPSNGTSWHGGRVGLCCRLSHSVAAGKLQPGLSELTRTSDPIRMSPNAGINLAEQRARGPAPLSGCTYSGYRTSRSFHFPFWRKAVRHTDRTSSLVFAAAGSCAIPTVSAKASETADGSKQWMEASSASVYSGT
jgi:hypothetical protein